MPLEPLHFLVLEKVVPPTLLSNQTPVLNQLPDPHRRYTQDLSGLFRSDQAHSATTCTPREQINQSESALPPRRRSPSRPEFLPRSRSGEQRTAFVPFWQYRRNCWGGKAMGGFANNEGGVLVWGLRCEKDKTTGIDAVDAVELVRGEV